MNILDEQSANTLVGVLASFLERGEKFKTIKILRDLKAKKVDISYLIDQILPLGDIIFYRFVKDEQRSLINSFNTFDKILHNLEPQTVIDLLHFNIIEPHIAAEVNNTSLDKVIYMIIQFTEYEPLVYDYLFKKYPRDITHEGLLNHMIFYNICHDIFIYINACNKSNRNTAEFLNFERILESYQRMYDKYKDDEKQRKFLRSRLIGLAPLISKQCKDRLLMMPEYEEYKAKFQSYYQINHTNDTDANRDTSEIIRLLDKICYDSYDWVNDKVPWGSQR
jgi:hypothetical protein